MIHLITVVGSRLDLLPHMLRHYRTLGVDDMTVGLHLESMSSIFYNEAASICESFGANIGPIYVGSWYPGVNPFLYAIMQERAPEDWYILADVDEFHIYPSALNTFLQAIADRGFDYVNGCLVDRLGPGGTLPAVEADRPLWQQFPLAALITDTILKGDVRKVVAARGHVVLGVGQHSARSGVGCPPSEHYIPVHHFKWADNVVDGLRIRAEFYRRHGVHYWRESQRFLDYCESRGPTIDISDPQLLVAPAKKYCYWEQAKARALAFGRTPRADCRNG